MILHNMKNRTKKRSVYVVYGNVYYEAPFSEQMIIHKGAVVM